MVKELPQDKVEEEETVRCDKREQGEDNVPAGAKMKICEGKIVELNPKKWYWLIVDVKDAVA